MQFGKHRTASYLKSNLNKEVRDIGVELRAATILTIVEELKNNNFSRVKTLLQNAIAEDMEDAEIYNLLGIYYEKRSDRANAIKFYRVAYYMDQTFTEAAENLKRVCEFSYKGASDVKWGNNRSEAKK